MAKPELSAAQVRQLLQGECRKAGGQKAWAMQHEMSPAYVSDVLQSVRAPGPTICAALGLERVVYYVPAGRTALSAEGE